MFQMKKTLLLAGVASLFSLNAQATEIKPVIGLDYVYSIADIDDSDSEGDYSDFYEDKLNAFALSAGVKLNQYVGLEAFYQQSEKADKTTYGILKVEDKYKAYGLDAIGYLPVIPQLDLIGSLGVAYYKAEVKFSISGISASDSEDKIGFRAGAGLQYNFNDHIAARLMAKYNYTNIDGLDNIVDVTAGVRYYF